MPAVMDEGKTKWHHIAHKFLNDPVLTIVARTLGLVAAARPPLLSQA